MKTLFILTLILFTHQSYSGQIVKEIPVSSRDIIFNIVRSDINLSRDLATFTKIYGSSNVEKIIFKKISSYTETEEGYEEKKCNVSGDLILNTGSFSFKSNSASICESLFNNNFVDLD